MAFQESQRALGDPARHHRREEDDIALIALESVDRIRHELERSQAAREILVLMHQRADAVRLGAERSDHADGAVVVLLDNQSPQLCHDRLRLRGVERAAAGGPDDLAFHIQPAHSGTGSLVIGGRTLQALVIRGNPKPSAIEVPVRKRNDVAVRAVMIAQGDDIFVAAQAAGEVE